MKLGFAEAYPPPQIGLYGNHIAAYFNAEAFGRPEDAEYFFNYFYANLSLPEIHRYLLHVEQNNRLPRKLILVQITPPNADNGRFIINSGNELPPDIVLSAVRHDGLSGRVWPTIAVVWELVNNWLHEILNYNTVLLSVIQSGGYKERTINPANCHDDTPTWVRRLPSWKLQNVILAVGGFRMFCLQRLWWGALRRDGSQLVETIWRSEAGQDRAPIVQNEDPLRESERGLRGGDEREIARQMRAITAVGVRHGINVVFFIPPVYETDRHDSVVNVIFNRALVLVPDITVIDHRYMHNNPLHFESSIHPSLDYYRIVAEELRRRGFIE